MGSQHLYIFPPNFQTEQWQNVDNENIDALAYAMDYLYLETSVETNNHVPLYDVAARIAFDNMENAFDDTDAAQATLHEAILDTVAECYQFAGWNYASDNILNLTAYSTTAVLQIKKNIFRERWYLHERIGFKYPVIRILEIYGFTSITLSDTVAPAPLWDGTFSWDGTISWDGDYTGAEYIFDVSATKPAALTDAQAEYIGAELCRSFIPAYSKLHTFTLV